MKKLRNHLIGVDSGDVVVFSEYENGGDMWTGQGQRERRQAVQFSEAFKSPPVVQVNLSLWDVNAATVMRADIAAEAVTEQGFDIVFRTWGDTRVARVRMSWSAIGELPQDDDWDVR
jgi:H-type lectin domain